MKELKKTFYIIKTQQVVVDNLFRVKGIAHCNILL